MSANHEVVRQAWKHWDHPVIDVDWERATMRLRRHS